MYYNLYLKKRWNDVVGQIYYITWIPIETTTHEEIILALDYHVSVVLTERHVSEWKNSMANLLEDRIN